MDLFKFFIPKPFRPDIERVLRERWHRQVTFLGYDIKLKWDRHFIITDSGGNTLMGEVDKTVIGYKITFADNPDISDIQVRDDYPWFYSKKPLNVFDIDGEMYYFHNGFPVSHDSVLSTLGELPQTITEQQQQLYGLNAPPWYTWNVGVQLKKYFGLNDTELLSIISENDCFSSEKVQFNKIWSNSPLFSNETTMYIPTSKVVFTLHDGVVVYASLKKQKAFETTIRDVNSLMGDDKKRFLLSISAGDFSSLGLTPYTGVAPHSGMEFFWHDGDIVSDEMLLSILGEVPERFTDEHITLLTLSL